MRRPLFLAAALASLLGGLSGCGVKTDLKPAPGAVLPVAPYGRAEQLTSKELLTPPVQAAPERSVELRNRSEEREDDPFDLPPED